MIPSSSVCTIYIGSSGVWFAINWHLHLVRIAELCTQTCISSVYVYIHTGTPPMKSRAITLISPRYCNLLLKMILCYKIGRATSFVHSFVRPLFFFVHIIMKSIHTVAWSSAHTNQAILVHTVQNASFNSIK